jgi:glyoxylase-like metal-dependent hydrolase (beta-lactamase superfamily II)
VRLLVSDDRVKVFTAGAFAENGYVVRDADAGCAIIVDPGACAEDQLAWLRETGDRLDAIVLTHAHLDHVEGIPLVRRAWPDVPILLHDDDLPLYRGVPAQGAMFGMDIEPLPVPTGRLEQGEPVRCGGLAFQVRCAPGHAPGHVILVSVDLGLALTGDVVFLGSIGRTDLPGGDFHQLMDSIRREILGLPDEMRLLTGHGPETTVGHERASNPFLVPQYRGHFA